MFIKNIIKGLFVFITITSARSTMVMQQLQQSTNPKIFISSLIESQISKLENSTVFVFVTAYNERPFALNLATSLKLNMESLSAFGIKLQTRLLCDGNSDDQIAFTEAFREVELPETNCKIALNERNIGIGKTRTRNLILARDDVMNEIASGRHTYFTLIDGDDMIHKDYLLISLSAALATGSDVIKIEDVKKDFPQDVEKVAKLQVQDLSEMTCSIERTPVDIFLRRDDHCCHLFAAKNIFNTEFDFDF